mgnify:CR=1 FL=1
MSADVHPCLDAASSEPLHPAAREVFSAAIESGYADPRRLHHDGRRARLLLDNARQSVAESLSVRPDEVTFTTSGTEAVHRGLLGLHRGRAARRHAPADPAAQPSTAPPSTAGPPTVLPSAVEHSAVLHAVDWLRDASGGVAPPTQSAQSIPVTGTGLVTAEAVREAFGTLSAPPTVVAVQHANHEVGTVQPIAEIAEALESLAHQDPAAGQGAPYGPVPLFVDACAGAGRLPLPTGWAALAASAHKWGGPAGVGLLLVRKGARWRNPFPVDDRVDPRTSGFENVPAILAAAAALGAMVAERDELAARQAALVDRIRHQVARLPDVEVVGEPVRRLPHLVTFSCLYVDGEALVGELDRRGLGVASGSACAASTLQPSHVLAAMGSLSHGNVRLSLGRETGADTVEAFLAALPEVLAELRGRVGM